MVNSSVKTQVVAPLDPAFAPFILSLRQYRQAVNSASKTNKVILALERNSGLITRYELNILADPTQAEQTYQHLERIVKFMLWAYGGWKLFFAGPQNLYERLASTYSKSGERAFDVDLMQRVYDKSFTVTYVSESEAPQQRDSTLALGGHLNGCRIGFDLGASDYKIAAVKEGEPVFSTEIPWNPKDQPDPSYHYQRIQEGLKLAASHLPRVDAIGGSSAGVYIDNQVMVASLFRAVPKSEFETKVKPMFRHLEKEWGVPVVVINDGDVTALAGAMSLEKNAILGVAMGSSEAAGYLDRNGKIPGWLTELAFAPVDLNPSAACDEWSGDRGVGALYFSQQAVNKLAPAAGIEFPKEMDLPNRLKSVQERMSKGDPAAKAIFETIGVYLGYTIPLYREFYDFDHMLILGRVTSGVGGEIILNKAKEVLKKEFPDLASSFNVFLPDEKSRRVGQAVAAASLPVTKQ